MGTQRKRKMKDLSRESVEDVCTHFRSPHIARKYGHKIYSDYQDPYLSAMQRALSVDSRTEYDSSPPPPVPVRPSRGCDEVKSRKQAMSWQEGDYQLYCKSLSHSTADQHNRDLIRKTKSWRSAPPSSVKVTSGDKNNQFRFSEIPKIFIYHSSTLKNYFKSWN